MLPVRVETGEAKARKYACDFEPVNAGAMLDSGAMHDLIDSGLIARAGLQMHDAPVLSVKLADGSVITSRHMCVAQLQIGDVFIHEL